LFLKRIEDAGYTQPFEDEIAVKDVMDEVVKFIRANLAIDKKELLKLDNLAGYFVMSLPTLKISFKKKHGIAIHEFIIECRMEWAILLITKTCRSVKEIAYQMGYEEPCNFSRDF
jgi:AraC-like DNA-binding protein